MFVDKESNGMMPNSGQSLPTMLVHAVHHGLPSTTTIDLGGEEP